MSCHKELTWICINILHWVPGHSTVKGNVETDRVLMLGSVEGSAEEME